MDIAKHVRDAVGFSIRKHADWDSGATTESVELQIDERINQMDNLELLERIGEAIAELSAQNPST